MTTTQFELLKANKFYKNTIPSLQRQITELSKKENEANNDMDWVLDNLIFMGIYSTLESQFL